MCRSTLQSWFLVCWLLWPFLHNVLVHSRPIILSWLYCNYLFGSFIILGLICLVTIHSQLSTLLPVIISHSETSIPLINWTNSNTYLLPNLWKCFLPHLCFILVLKCLVYFNIILDVWFTKLYIVGALKLYSCQQS